MKLYLSSYKLGNKAEKIQSLISHNKPLAYISNALDFSNDLERRKASEQGDIDDLKSVNVSVETLDLRNYFNKEQELKRKLINYGGIWVRGGNVFVLRQAFKLSGLDKIITELKNDTDFFYGGYSAGVCVLAETLKGIDLVDDPSMYPYDEVKETVWDGVGLLGYSIAPHYDSEHKESEDIDNVVRYFIENKMLFKALSDGDVIISEV